MPVEVERARYPTREQVLEDVKQSGFWPTTIVSGPSPQLPVHWHSEEVHAYVLDGETSIIDAESGVEHPVSCGDKIVVPARALHAEGASAMAVTYIVAVPEALPPGEFLKLRTPEER